MKNFVYIVVMGAVFFFGWMASEPEETPQPNQSTLVQIDRSKPVTEMYAELMNEESKAQYDKMHAQLQEYEQKKEERHNRWMLVVYVCGVIAVLPTLYMLLQFVSGKLDLHTGADVARVFGVCIGAGILLFAVNLSALYLMFYAERSIQVMALAAILFGGGAALWIASLKTKKKEQEMAETKNENKQLV